MAKPNAQIPVNFPLNRYRELIGRTLVPDAAQHQVITALDNVYWQLIEEPKCQSRFVKGVYIWGDVGRGKSFLMDLFYECLPQKGKLRLHFHHFMAQVHQSLKQYSGQQDPLPKVAKGLASSLGDKYRVLCFDEFFVSDIGDAMLLSGLFDCLFSEGVVLVATSNIPIERLYEHGLARHKFLPCIDLLQRHTQILHLKGEVDHRVYSVVMSGKERSRVSDFVGI
ncbi:Cell division protein ZapE [Paraglaciecola mesophila]|uniref:Cell division protein ZapE n=1 Tax=Paraglaciecola mesophila TaxID=197222 RepID=A0A857JRY0_9ALTE|nr:Cell division protein ZapE [Paraglaciecola mesophila]